MLRRYLDVCLQYRRILVLAAILVPSLLVAGGVGLDHTRLVTARLWAQPPTYMVDPSLYGGYYGVAPQTEAGLMANLLRELVSMNSFADADLRKNLVVTTEGSHLLVLTYRTDQPDRGIAVLNRLISAFAETAPIIHFQNPPASGTAAARLSAARSAVAFDVPKIGTRRRVVDPAAAPPRLGTAADLRAVSEIETIQYRRRIAALGGPPQADSAGVTMPYLKQAIVQVIDAPTAQADAIGPIVKLFALGLGAMAALEFLLVYLIGLHDQRLRSGDDVEKRTGIRYLGSPVPTLRTR
jgi:hypothetical protein